MTVKEFRAFLSRTGLTADWLGDSRPVMEKRYYLMTASGDTTGEFFVDRFGATIIHVRLY